MTIGENRAARYTDLFATTHAHEDVSDCAYCPICSAISVIRKTRPEVVEHLAGAAKELAIVAGLLLEEAGRIIASAEAAAKPPAGAERSSDNVRHLDVS